MNDEISQKMLMLGVISQEFEEKFVRGQGKGGQKINKTSNCVQLKHLPTGIEVKVQKHRELQKNRLSAFRLILSKIEDLKLGKASKRNQKIEKLKKQKARRKRRNKVLSVD